MDRNVPLWWAKYGDGLILLAFAAGLVYMVFDLPVLADPVGSEVSRTRFVSLMTGTFVAGGLQTLYVAAYIYRDPSRAVAHDVKPVTSHLGQDWSSRRFRRKMDYSTDVGARAAARTLVATSLVAICAGVIALVAMT